MYLLLVIPLPSWQLHVQSTISTTLTECLQISLLVLSEFKQIN